MADGEAPSKPNVIAQTAKSSGPTFNLALIEGSSHKDLVLEVKMKPAAGEIDQGGGLVWRARDAKNYYLARFNPLEDNFRVHKVADGKRSQLQSAELEAADGWHTLKIEMAGERIQCFFDGKRRLEVKDDTFKDAGQIGLWTKADAQTRFDDLEVRAPGDGGKDEGKKDGK